MEKKVMDVQTDKMSEEQRDEQLKQRFKNLGDTDISILYFGLMQIKRGLEMVSDVNCFPSTHAEDAWVVANERLERFVAAYLDNVDCFGEFNIQAIDEAEKHLERISFLNSDLERVLKTLNDIRYNIIKNNKQS